MKCQDFEKNILMLTRNQLVDGATRKQGLIHQEGCARCAERLTEEQALLAGVRAVVAEIASEEAPARLEAVLLKAFRERAAAATTANVIALPSPIKDWRRWQPAAIAAGISILFSLVVFFWQQSNSLSHQREERAALPQSPTAPEPQSLPPVSSGEGIDQNVAQGATSQGSQKRRRRQASRNNLSKAEVVTEFFPLMEGGDLDALESGQIVRIEVPGSALLAVGLAVDAAMASEPVKADVVLGHDGLARAIRFVR